MKQWYVHLIYLSIIAYLGYNYWSSVQAFKAFEQLDRQLHVDSEALEESSERLLGTFKKTVMLINIPTICVSTILL